MRTDLFDFNLPEAAIALRPVAPRDAARLLVVDPARPGVLEHRHVRDLAALLRAGDVLVTNDTRVLPARLSGIRCRSGATVAADESAPPARARIEANLVRRLDESTWVALARPAKRLAVGDRVAFGWTTNVCLVGRLDATVIAKGEGGEVSLAFDLSGPDLDRAIAEAGAMPLPPYIARKRAADARDRVDYQTIFARHEGAVAAPTAGLHITEDLLAGLERAGIGRLAVTLHVGAGTFLPVKAEDTADHVMHAEWGEVSPAAAATLNRVRAAGGRLVALGTTALRLIESAAAPDGTIRPFAGETAIFIVPGYRFRAVDGLVTNFHLPRSTLVMLVAAFAGSRTWRAAYAHAVLSGYRFYSYGDAGLWWRAGPAAE